MSQLSVFLLSERPHVVWAQSDQFAEAPGFMVRVDVSGALYISSGQELHTLGRSVFRETYISFRSVQA